MRPPVAEITRVALAVADAGREPSRGPDEQAMTASDVFEVLAQPLRRRSSCSIDDTVVSLMDAGELTLPNLRFVRHLGEGATGSVSLMRIADTDVVVAVKTMNKARLTERNKQRRLLMEHAVLTSSQHPFVASLYCTLQTEREVHFVMEFCPGGTLAEHLVEHGTLRESRVKFLAIEVITALAYLHSMGCTFRDLKTENVLLTVDGHVRLTDFDLCAMQDGFVPTVRTTRTLQKTASCFLSRSHETINHRFCGEPTFRTNSFVGTEEYVAPEIIRGGHYGPAVDWWALGILLHELAYGVTPFIGYSRKETFDRIVNDEFAPPSDSSTTTDFEDLLGRLLCKDEAQRLGSDNGAEDIKSHPWFRGVHWALLQSEDGDHYRICQNNMERSRLVPSP